MLVLDTVTGRAADAFYRSLGWQETGVVPNYALEPGRPAVGGDVLLEGPAVSGSGATVLIAPDSFKGSLTPSRSRGRSPTAGGGRGPMTRPAVPARRRRGGHARGRRGGRWLEMARGRGHRPASTARCVRAGCGRATAGGRSSRWPRPRGCRASTPEERDPTGASTVGTGEVLRAVIESGVEQVTLGIGGSATTDGGYGILEALGVGATPERDGFLHLDELDYLANVDLRVACDVTNPLLGPRGAAAIYGPQKGATPEQVERARRAPRALRRPAGRGGRARRAGDARGRRGRGRGVRPAVDPGPLSVVRAAARASTSSWS